MNSVPDGIAGAMTLTTLGSLIGGQGHKGEEASEQADATPERGVYAVARSARRGHAMNSMLAAWQ